MNIAPMAKNIASRTRSSSVSSVSVSHEYAAQAHHTTARIISARSRPSQLGSSAMNAVTCVMANTNTRSKNSSSGVTASSWS